MPDYDVKLATTLEAIDLDQPLPTLWKEFDALAARAGDGDPRRQFGHPVGGHGRRHAGAPHPASTSIEVPDEGHAPLLTEADIIGRIAAFVAACEAATH